MSHFGMGAPLSATCRGAPEKRRYINDIHPEITVAPKNVLWILGWCVCQNAEPFTTPGVLPLGVVNGSRSQTRTADPLINSSERCVRWRSGWFVGGRVYSVYVGFAFAQVR